MAKRSAFGSQLLLSDGAATPVYTAVPGLQDFGFPGPNLEVEDVTTHDSPDRYREFIPTVRDPGEISVTVLFDYLDATHKELWVASGSTDSRRDFRVQDPDGTILADFTAFVSVDPTSGLPMTGAQTVTFNLRATGAIVAPWSTAT